MRNQTSKMKLLSVPVLVLGLLVTTAFAALLLANNLAYAQLTVDFDFDTGSPPPYLYQSTPFNYVTSSGVTGRFSSPMDPAYSVQNEETLSFIKLSTFFGNFLDHSSSYRTHLEIKFSQPLTNITFSFATKEYHGAQGEPSFINLTAYVDSAATTPIGTASARGTWPGEGTPAGDTYPQGTLTFISGNPFNLVIIELPFQGNIAASSFLVDSIRVTTADLALDTVPPVTTLSLSGTAGNQGWYTSDVEVSLSATDDWSGVAKIEFSLDNATWTTYTTPFSITTEGTTIVYYKSTDAIGNVEATLSQSVKIDKSTPTGAVVINGDAASTTSTSVTLTLTLNDAFSGVFKVRYSNDGTWDTEQWETTSASKTWTLTAGYGIKTVYYQIKDNAGLISATYQDSITLEATQPPVDTTKPVAHAGPDRAVTEDTILTLDGSASTDNVAVTSYTWEFIDATTKTLTGVKPTYTFDTPGLYTITLNVTDAAGNWATDTVVIEVIDVTNPIADAGQDRTVNVNASVTFDASASTDNVGIVSYTWDCGDGTTHTGKTIAHTYNVSGTYTVTLTVEDAAGNMANHSINVTAVPTPAPSSSQASQLWIILAIMAIGMGVTAALFLKKRK